MAARRLAKVQAVDVDAIAITHIHPENSLDLIAIGYALMTEWIKHLFSIAAIEE